MRELKEETGRVLTCLRCFILSRWFYAVISHLCLHAGYVGRVTEVSPICYSDPGMTNANMQFAVVDVDADAPENASVNPELEVGSLICLATHIPGLGLSSLHAFK